MRSVPLPDMTVFIRECCPLCQRLGPNPCVAGPWKFTSLPQSMLDRGAWDGNPRMTQKPLWEVLYAGHRALRHVEFPCKRVLPVSPPASRARTEALDALHYATLTIGDPQPIREQIENLRDLLTALWLLHEAALIAVDRHQHRY